MEGRLTTVCFLACQGLQPNLLHLLWRLTLAGERYAGGGEGWRGLGGDQVWHLYHGLKPAGKRPGLDATQRTLSISTHTLFALDDPCSLPLTLRARTHMCVCHVCPFSPLPPPARSH